MKSEIKQRIETGLLLILLLILMFISKTIYLFISLVIFAISFIEFSKISKKIYKTNYLKNFFSNLFFVTYLFLFLLVFILGINDIHFKIILFVTLLVCIASDIGGLVFGKIFKGPKLTKISPNKTLTGSFGSFLFSILMGNFILSYLFNTEIINNFLFGVIVSLSVQIGDLIFSYLKRKSSIKNTGNILPGHGGILDRIDGILLGVPIGLIYLLILVFTK